MERLGGEVQVKKNVDMVALLVTGPLNANSITDTDTHPLSDVGAHPHQSGCIDKIRTMLKHTSYVTDVTLVQPCPHGCIDHFRKIISYQPK